MKAVLSHAEMIIPTLGLAELVTQPDGATSIKDFTKVVAASQCTGETVRL